MSLRIPLPPLPGQKLERLPNDLSQIMSRILTGRQNAQRLEQQRIANEQLNKYRMGSLDISRGNLDISRLAEQRAQKLMPYLVQSYKDTHNKSLTDNELNQLKLNVQRQQYNDIMKGMGGNLGNNQPPSSPDNVNSPNTPVSGMLENNNQQSNQLPSSLAEVMEPLFNQNYSLNREPYTQYESPEQTIQQLISTPKDNNLSIPNVPQFKPEIRNENLPQNQTSIPNITQNQVTANKPNQAGYKSGQEITIRPGRPGFETMDKFAGTSMGKPVKTHTSKGWIYSEYPSGKITAVQNPYESAKEGGETPEQKRASELEKEKALASYRSGLTSQEKEKEYQLKRRDKKNDEIEKDDTELNRGLSYASNMLGILDRNASATGFGNKLLHAISMTGEEIGSFDQGSQYFQGMSAKQLSSRGGLGVAKMVEQNKPSRDKAVSYNFGALKMIKSALAYKFLEQQEKYEKNNPGEKYNNELSSYFPTLTLRVPKDDENPERVIKLDTNQALKLVKDHPTVRIIG